MHDGFSTPHRRAAFVLNCRAGRFRKSSRLVDAVVSEIRARADVYATASGGELAEAAKNIVESGARRVVLCGGDGTYLASISAIAAAASGRPLPEFVLVRSGTVSTVARNWRGPRDAVETARRVCERPESFVVT